MFDTPAREFYNLPMTELPSLDGSPKYGDCPGFA